ncbi:hypothetical protein [Seonamhaeicola sp. ML3]|nr:hypothetical protein [Seonamhaeicola sp. ML3]
MKATIKSRKKENLDAVLYLLMLFLTLPVITGILILWFRFM